MERKRYRTFVNVSMLQKFGRIHKVLSRAKDITLSGILQLHLLVFKIGQLYYSPK